MVLAAKVALKHLAVDSKDELVHLTPQGPRPRLLQGHQGLCISLCVTRKAAAVGMLLSIAIDSEGNALNLPGENLTLQNLSARRIFEAH